MTFYIGIVLSLPYNITVDHAKQWITRTQLDIYGDSNFDYVHTYIGGPDFLKKEGRSLDTLPVVYKGPYAKEDRWVG